MMYLASSSLNVLDWDYNTQNSTEQSTLCRV